MGKIEVEMPKMGESVMEATITKWLFSEGDAIEEDEPIVEIATDKVDSEVPAPASGTLGKQLFKEGDVVKIGDVFAEMEVDGAQEPAPNATTTEQKPPETSKTLSNNGSDTSTQEIPGTEALESVATQVEKTPDKQSSNRFYSPLVKTIAKKEGITGELDKIAGSGLEGRVTKKDILSYLKTRQPDTQKYPETQQPKVAAAQKTEEKVRIEKSPVSVGGQDQVVEMSRMRKLIADHMVMSKQTSPHVTSYVEADVTNLVKWRSNVKDQFQKKYNEKLTFTPLFFEAVIQALKEFPGVNASVDGHNIILRGKINIGMATALPSGDLIVPVIKNADQKNLLGLTKTVNDLANRARNNQLEPDEIQGGTYTITNVGTFGNVMGTPIINQPQVGILALGAIRKRPAVLETPDGDVIAIRHMMFLSHAYDHRVVDGALGGKFVRRVADLLESWDSKRDI